MSAEFEKKVLETLETFEKRFDSIDQRFDSIDQRFNAVDQRFDSVDQRFDSVDQRFHSIDQTLQDFRNEVKQEFWAVRTEVQTNADEVNEKISRLERRMQAARVVI